MTTNLADSASPQPENAASPMVLRGSYELQNVPPERAPAPAPAAAVAPAAQAAPAARDTGNVLPAFPAPSGLLLPAELTWALASATLMAGVGWLYERRRRRLVEMERDSVLWTSVRNQTRAGAPRPGLDEILPDGPDPDEAARAIYVAAIGETTSRREATLIDLHQLQATLEKLRGEHDTTAAAELLEQHLVDFRYTSPWIFLELRELYKELERPAEWEVAREAFRNRFGQNAPQWAAPSTAGAEIAADKQLCHDLLRKWPHREARMFILRWLLGDPQSRQKSMGPPQLALGVYRDMMLLDAMLDDVMQARPVPAPVRVPAKA